LKFQNSFFVFKKFFLSCSFCLLFVIVSGQKLTGLVVDVGNVPIKGVSVYVLETESGKISGFGITNEEGQFKINFNGSTKDSLVFSFLGFQKLVISVGTFEIKKNTVTLYKTPIVLSEVIINSPIMQSGDTTKFKVDFFKEQTDHKLKDLVEHLPGFEITGDGKLKYQDRFVEKITIQGEDLFADKTSLLLNSVPTHALDEVQVLQNQLKNKKLKGFEPGNHVYLNLSLKKDRVKVGFGDAEVGANTKGRGLVNFTNFILSRKVKLGLIGGFESLGQSTSSLEDELTDPPYKELNSWVLTEPSLESFYRLPEVYYKFNNLVNARVKANIPFSKKASSETEVNFISDRESQNRQFDEVLLDSSGFVSQFRKSNYLRKPLRILFAEKFHLDISENRDLKISLNWIGDFLKASEERSLHRTFVIDTTSNFLKNRGNDIALGIEYLHKLSSAKVNSVKLQAYSGEFSQDLLGISQNYFSAFDLPQTGNGWFSYPLNAEKEGAQLQIIRMIKTKKRTFNYGLIAKYDRVLSKNGASLKDVSSGSMSEIKPLNSEITFESLTGKFFIKYPFSGTKIPVSMEASGGVQYYSRQFSANQSNTWPLYDFSIISEKRKLRLYYNIRLQLKNQLPSLLSYNPFYRATQFNSFRVTKQPLSMVHEQSIRLSFRVGKSQYIPFMSFDFSRESAGLASSQFLKSNIQYISDSLFRKPIINSSFSANWNIYPRKTKLKIYAYYFLFFDQSRVLINNEISLQLNINMQWKVSVSRNWKKKFFTVFKFEGNYFIPQQHDRILLPMQPLFNWNIGWNNKYQFPKSASVGVDATYFTTDALSKNSIDFTSFDLFGDYSIPKSLFNVSFAIQNILNQKFLTFADQSPVYQSIYKIPLLGTNFLLKLRYEL